MTFFRKAAWAVLFGVSAVLTGAEADAPAPEATAEYEQKFAEPFSGTDYAKTIPMPRAFLGKLRKIKDPEIDWECEVSATEAGKLAGFKFKIFSPEKNGTRAENLFWKKKIPAEPMKLSGKIAFKTEGRITNAVLIVYNLNKTGAMRLHSIRLTAKGAVRPKEAPVRKVLKKIDPASPVPQNPLTFRMPRFMTGVYFYLGLSRLGKTPEEWEKKFRDCMKDIAAHHCNTVYISGISGNPDAFNKCCKIAAEYGLNVIGQGNGPLYLRPENGRDYFESRSLPALRAGLPKLKADNLIGFTVKEEVNPNDPAIEMLRDGREEQRKLMPGVPAFTLHNVLPSVAMDDDPERQPDMYAFDMYRFKLHPERHVVMTPSKAAFRIPTNLEIAYLHAAKFGKPLIFVAQGVKTYVTVKSKKYTKASGMTEIEPGVWRGYGRYMPKYGMNLQFWLGVMSGCRGILIYHYMTSRSETALVDIDLKPQPYWTEFSDCLAEAEPLFPLFNSWYKQQPDPAYSASPGTVKVRTFKHPDFKGTFILPVNTLIARWDKTNPRLTTVKTQLHSDEENLQGFEWAEPQTCTLKVKDGDKVYDLLTGKEADLQKITLEPGKGRVFFQGSESELENVRKFLKLR
ncbi:MAG: hypothetical protein IJS14_10785 [Lentisphaeria bacterium]|nr:hypothetical protein [Lentisphaeria bacterium]